MGGVKLPHWDHATLVYVALPRIGVRECNASRSRAFGCYSGKAAPRQQKVGREEVAASQTASMYIAWTHRHMYIEMGVE